jgi:hypothetical protein
MRALKLRNVLLASWVLLGASVLSAVESVAPPQGLTAKGYLSLRYAYAGSASKDTVYQALRLTGSFELSALSNKVILHYRSQHYFTIQHTKTAIFGSPYENRNIFQTIYLEFRDVIAKGLRVRVGRMFPDMDYASLMLIDGGWLSWDFGKFSLVASAGRTIDYWQGKPDDGKLQFAGGVRYQSENVRVFAGFSSGDYYGLKRTELPAGMYARVGPNTWFDAYASYDFHARELARAGLSFTWRVDKYNFSLMTTQWRNPFDQLYLADKTINSIYWGDFVNLPVTYRDVRLSFSTSGKGFGFRGTAGWLGGVRSGWLGNATITLPGLLGFRFSLGGQAMKTDFIQFYSADLIVQKQFGEVLVQVQSQERYYQWQPRASGFHNFDNYTELSVEYPLTRHFYLSLAGGGYFRALGNEAFKPMAEFRIIYRI